MSLQTKPDDYPAAVRFHIAENGGAFEVACSCVDQAEQPPYRILDGSPRFANRDAFKAKIVQVGMTPAVAEEPCRSFNATARQLRGLGFSVELPEDGQGKKQKAA